MTSRRSILLGLVLGAFLGVFGLNSVYAQVPRSISYQGFLLKNGQPVTGPVTLDIAIKDAAGNILYPESIQTTAANGIFNVLIGGLSGTLPATMKFDQQYYLTVSLEGQAVGDPTPFTAAPYALNSQTVGGIGVSVTPQPGMLLPLDANGKVPAAALPQASSTLTSIDHMSGDVGGNVQLAPGPGITITDAAATNTITIGLAAGAGSSPDTITTLPPLTGSAIGTRFTIGLSNATNWITPGMLGTSSVRGSNLDQNIPQLGLYQDALGDLNVGTNGTLTYVTPTNTGAPGKPFGGIGLNLNNPNTWTALQTFNAGVTVNGTTTLNGPVILTPGTLTINGTPEPLAAPNAATYEIIDNGDLKVTGSSYLVGNTYIGAATNGGTNTMGTAGQSTNTITGTSNTITGSVSNTIAAPTNTVGTSGSSTNTIQGATNNVTGGTNNITGTTNNLNATTNNLGTVSGQTNNIGTGGSSTNTMGVVTSGTNNIVALTNNVNGATNNVGTNAASTNNIGNAGSSTNTITGANNTITATGTTTTNGNFVHNGTGEPNAATAAAVTNYELKVLGDVQISGATSHLGNVFMSQTLSVGGLTTLTGVTNTGALNQNGVSTFNGNIVQTTGTTTLLNTQTGNLTVVGTLTQSGGNATINGGTTNVFGTALGSSNTIGGAGSTNTYNGQNNFNGNINQTSGTSTLLNTQINGTLGSTGNITLGTASSNNNIGNAAAINTTTGATNNIVGGTNNFTGATNNVNASVNNIGGNSGSVNNIGVVSGGGISTTNVGNLNNGTNNNVSGTTTFTGATLTGADGNEILRVVGGPQSCAGPLPTAMTSQAFFDGDVWDAGTLSACRLNIFGSGGSCIANLNTTTFGACAGGATTIALISGLTGNNAPNGGFPINITNIDNVQVNTNLQTNNSLTIGTTGTNATVITSSNAGPAAINQQTPSVAGRIPTFQQYILALVPGTGPNGGGSVTFNAGNTGGQLNFDALSGMTVSYRSHNVGFPVGELWITQTLTDVTVESSAAGDNNMVQLVILRP